MRLTIQTINFTTLLVTAVFLTLPGCGQDMDNRTIGKDETVRIKTTSQHQEPTVIASAEPGLKPAIIASRSENLSDTQIEFGNTRYLFVTADHTASELEALLQRADEITRSGLEDYDQFKLALVIHGQNIDLFTNKNYQKNKGLIDLAEKLDAFKVMDLKICQWSMSKRGVSEDEIPSFVEPVPFAPDEIVRLTNNGYLNL